MKLTLQIKLLTSEEQFDALKSTIIMANSACDSISEIAWDKHIFGQYKLHKEVYYSIKKSFNLSAQMIVRCISKVSDSYKKDKRTKREFKKLGAVAYDSRILSYGKDFISIWTTGGGRIKIPFTCHNKKYLSKIKGEADLILRNDNFYLLQTVDIKDRKINKAKKFLGVDFGRTDIAFTSNGNSFSSAQLNKTRNDKFKVRKSVQTKADNSSSRSTQRNCRRLIKRLSGRERRFASHTNHVISKQIVQMAKSQNKGIAIEDLTGIRKAKIQKAQKREHNSWAFHQLRQFLAYKSALSGIQLVAVQPHYTSQTCNCCKHIGIRKGKLFKCKNTNCGYEGDADYNASLNIAQLGESVNFPEKSAMYCNLTLH